MDGWNETDRDAFADHPLLDQTRRQTHGVIREAHSCARGKMRPNFPDGSVKPKASEMTCADFTAYGKRGYDNGRYVGHDEPSIGFNSTLPRSGNSVQWDITLPTERPLPATQSYFIPVEGQFCFGVASVDGLPTILGDAFLHGVVAIFDVDKSQIGFAAQSGCAASSAVRSSDHPGGHLPWMIRGR